MEQTKILNEGFVYPSEGINGWCLQSVDKLGTIPANPLLKDHVHEEPSGEGPKGPNGQQPPMVPAPNHEVKYGKGEGQGEGQGDGPSNTPTDTNSSEPQNGQGGQEGQKKANTKTVSTGVDDEGKKGQIVEVNLSENDFKKIQKRTDFGNFGNNVDVLSEEDVKQMTKDNPELKDKLQAPQYGEQSKEAIIKDILEKMEKNCASNPGRTCTIHGSVKRLIDQLQKPTFEFDWTEILEQFMSVGGSSVDYQESIPDFKLGVAGIPGASIEARTGGDYYTFEAQLPDAMSSILYLVDKSGSMYGQRLSNGRDIFEEIFLQIIAVSEQVQIQESALAYYECGLFKNDDNVAYWTNGTSPEEILELIKRKDTTEGGGTDAIKALKALQDMAYGDADLIAQHPILSQLYNIDETKFIIITDGEDRLGRDEVDWNSLAIDKDRILWLIVNTANFFDVNNSNGFSKYCSSLFDYGFTNIICVSTDALLAQVIKTE